MARKLLAPPYNYSKDKLQVLLGGWNTWKENHIQDPKNYPTVPDVLPDQNQQPLQVVTTAPAQSTPKP